MSEDEKYMLRCLELAQLGAGSVAPNPMVGSVIVHDGKIIGEGYHQIIGEAHAEVNAINAVEDKSLLPYSTIYVSLEPCAHFGKTPPCADLIVKNKLKRAVIAVQDPFSKVNGAGIKRLVDTGIDVTVGVLESDAMELNRRFFTFHEKKRPYIILKWAETVDGFVDRIRENPSKPALKITSDAANTLVHKWRAEEAAIMVGKNTAILDNPSLTTRKYKGKNPVRILLDSNSATPKTDNIFNCEAETIVFTENARDLEQVLAELYHRDIQSVIIEGGPKLHQSFYETGLWDEIRRFVAPIEIREGIKALELNEIPEQEMEVGSDQLFIYRNR